MNRRNQLLDACADVMDVDTITLGITREELGEFDSLPIIQILVEMKGLFQQLIEEGLLQEVKIKKIRDFSSLLER